MTTVLRLIRLDEAGDHRTQLCDWLQANSLDPKLISDQWISIEQADSGAGVIRYRQYKVTPAGHRIVDPGDHTKAWAEERTTLLMVQLPPCLADPPPGW